LRENLSAARDQVFLNRELMELVTDVELDIDPGSLKRGEWEQGMVKKLFDSLEFHSLWEDLLAVQPIAGDIPAEVLDIETSLVADPERVAEFATGGRLVIEVVTSDGEPFGVSVLLGEESAAVVPLDALGPLGPALADPSVEIIGHDLKETVRP